MVCGKRLGPSANSGTGAVAEYWMFSRFVAPLQFGRHEIQQRLGWFGQVAGCGRMA